MKAQLKSTQMIEVDLPEYFSYTRWGSVNYCRVMGDNIACVTMQGVAVSKAKYTIEDLRGIESIDLVEIAKTEFRAKLSEVVELVIAEPTTESN